MSQQHLIGGSRKARWRGRSSLGRLLALGKCGRLGLHSRDFGRDSGRPVARASAEAPRQRAEPEAGPRSARDTNPSSFRKPSRSTRREAGKSRIKVMADWCPSGLLLFRWTTGGHEAPVAADQL
uniref:uncharacterized protein LOC128930090 n=1 Tax=Callithrix jacchus TaxID=9483 RepID=UPI0023DD0799|nr:uncharacterized protein LOC128930090 [Callithrix jacchus]